MSQIPNYVRLTTNRCEGSITEKVASHYLRKEGFVCEKFGMFHWRLGSIKYEQKKTEELRQLFLKRAEKQLKKDKEYWKRLWEKSSSKSPPKDWEDPRRTRAEVRKKEIKMAHNQMKAVEQDYEKSIEFERTWGTHFEHIVNYFKLLEEVNYIPDIIAKKGDKVFIVEVKSKTKQGLAPLGKHQKKGLLKAYDFGLTPILLVVPIDISIEIGEPKIRVIVE